MTDAIIVDYDAFDRESRFYVMKDNKHLNCRVVSDIETLVSSLISLAKETQIYDVKIRAPRAFVNEIDRQVKQLEMTTYSENKISIEGL